MGRPVHVEVSLDEVGGNPSRLIKKFIKKVKKSKILDIVREKRYYEKPSAKRRRDRMNKRRNAQKFERDRQKRLDIKY
jgi:ribosomal protein S21